MYWVSKSILYNVSLNLLNFYWFWRNHVNIQFLTGSRAQTLHNLYTYLLHLIPLFRDLQYISCWFHTASASAKFDAAYSAVNTAPRPSKTHVLLFDNPYWIDFNLFRVHPRTCRTSCSSCRTIWLRKLTLETGSNNFKNFTFRSDWRRWASSGENKYCSWKSSTAKRNF